MDALWEAMQLEERSGRRGSVTNWLRASLLEQVAEERQAFDQQVLARAEHFIAQGRRGGCRPGCSGGFAATSDSLKCATGPSLVRKFGSRSKSASPERSRCVSSCAGCWSQCTTTARRGRRRQTGGYRKSRLYQKFEGIIGGCRKSPFNRCRRLGRALGALKSADDGSASDVLDLPSFIEVFERLGLQFPSRRQRFCMTTFLGTIRL